MSKFKWINIFLRDILLVIIIFVVQYWTHFQSTAVFFISGMLFVWITWQLNDFLTERKRLEWHGKE